MSAAPTGFAARVQSQSWYPQVESEMQAQGVPDWLWISVVRSEDASLDPYVITYDPPGFSYGLFQFHNDPQDGLGATSAGAKAAQWLGNALAPLGTSYTPRQALTAAENAGWPGADPTLIAKEDPTRLANLQQTFSDLGLSYAGTTGGSAGATAALAPGVTTQQVTGATPSSTFDPFGINAAISNATSAATSIAQNVFIGGVILAIIAGGFALIAANSKGESSGGTTVVPVPV